MSSSSKQQDRPVQIHGPVCPPCRNDVATQADIVKFKRIYIKLAGCARHLEMWDRANAKSKGSKR